jgi:hypothetical protein
MFCSAKSGSARPAAAFFGVQKFVKFAESGTFISKADCNHYLTGICLAIKHIRIGNQRPMSLDNEILGKFTTSFYHNNYPQMCFR